MNHKSKCKNHFQWRLKARFGIVGDRDLLNKEVKQIITQKRSFFDNKTGNRSTHHLLYRNNWMKVVYDTKKKVCVTAIRPGRMKRRVVKVESNL